MPYGRIILGGLVGLTLLFYAGCGHAQDGDKRQTTLVATPGRATEEGETLKERLSDKASDDQRVDNCNVPVDRRGTKIRPDGCKHDDASATPARLPN
jgi:hypothetical protein